MDNYVRAVAALSNGDVLAGGHFIYPGTTVMLPFVSRWNGTSWSTLPSPNSYVEAVAELPNGDIVVGGAFTQVNGVSCNRIALWDGSVWSPLGSGMNGWVRALAVLPNGDIIAGGDFLSAGGVGVNRIARWNGTSWSNIGPGFNGSVRLLELLPNGDIVAGGQFTAVGVTNVNRLVRWDGASWSDMGGAINGTDFRGLALNRAGQLAVAGNMYSAGAEVSVGLARLATTCPAAADPIYTSCIGSAGPVWLTADSLPWVGSTFGSTATGFSSNVLAVSLIGFTSPNVPLTWIWPNTLPGCDQLASPEAVMLHLPQFGAASYSFAIPNNAVFAGLPLFHQFLQFELNAQNQLQSLSSSNGLALTVGAF